MLESWANRVRASFTGLIIPNVFGPFGHPYYNSVVATFCHQLTHDETPKVLVDNEVNLIYVGELVEQILERIEEIQKVKEKAPVVERFPVPHTKTIKVTEILAKLVEFKQNYYAKGGIPDLESSFEKNLFNTFLCYIDLESFFPFRQKLNSDNRGNFVELVHLQSGGQVSFSTTVSGITRGEHYHTRKAERFAVIKGKARIELRRVGTDKVLSFDLDGESPSFVDMPVWYTHNITNIGEESLYTIFWTNEPYDPADPDTHYQKVIQ